MINLLIRFFKSRFFRLSLRILGSLATAVVVISGYLAFLSFSTQQDKTGNSESEEEDSQENGAED